ncbi:MAG: PQQ-binding-like beta-propeller repeat protein, partial [Methanomassiliicoccales archaeon]
MGKKIKRIALISLGIMLILSLIPVMPFGMISKTVCADAPQTDDWPMFRHDMNRTGCTSSRAPNTNHVLWMHETTPTDIYTWGYCGSPAVAGGLVFQGGNRPNEFRGIDAVTGIQSWEKTIGERVTTSPTVANDRVLFASYDNNVYSLVHDTGAEDWVKNLNIDIDSSPTVHNGKVYIGSGRGDYVPTVPRLLYCLDETNGNILWTFQADGQIISSPTIVNDQVIFGSYDESVYALPADDPTPGDQTIDVSEAIWVFDAGARVVSSAAVEDGVVYIGALNGKLYALPLTDPNGDGTISSEEVIWEFTSANEIWSSCGIASDRVFIGSHDYYLYALPKEDPNDDGVISASEVIWKFQTTDKIWSSPSIAGKKVFIASEDYTLWALCEETGELIWNYIMPLQTEPFGSELLYASPSIVDGKVYIGNYDMRLYCFGDEDTTPPIVEGVTPANNSIDVPLNSNIEITFNETFCEALITDSSLIVQSSSGKYSTGRIIYNNQTNTTLFNPDEDFQPNEQYTVRLISRYFQDYAGNPLDGNENTEIDSALYDDYTWSFTTGELIGHKPKLEDCSVTPQQGYLNTTFEFYVTYTDDDDDAPIAPAGNVKVFNDDSLFGTDMVWAYDMNTPNSYLLDGDYTNGELYRFETQYSIVGEHKFVIECSDGSNTDRTDEFPLPTVLNAPPELVIPVQNVNEDEEYLLDLREFVSDIDNETIAFTFVEDSDCCEIIDGHTLSCLFSLDDRLSENDISSEVVSITVSDGINSVSQDVLFFITPVNDAPLLKPDISRLPSVTVDEDSVFLFGLDKYVTDPDTPLELLLVSDDSVNITSIGLCLYLLYSEPNSYENVSLTISDGSKTLEIYLEVNVLPKSAPPEEPQEEEIIEEPPEDDFLVILFCFLLIFLIVVFTLINLWMIYRHKQQKGYPPTPPGTEPPAAVQPSIDEESPAPEDKEPPPHDDEEPPPDDEDLPPPDDEELPPPDDEDLPPPD